jgi:hypothetical protein
MMIICCTEPGLTEAMFMLYIHTFNNVKGNKKVKISLLQAVEAPRVARGRGYRIF